jgi:hypothetical protein
MWIDTFGLKVLVGERKALDFIAPQGDETMAKKKSTAAAAPATTAKKKAASGEARETLVVGSKVKEVIREAELRSDGDLIQAVSEKVHELLAAAIHRAKENKRGTVRPYDL